VTFPLGAERGEAPFWCHDVTPRERRVPVNEKNTAHPCGATGMTSITAGVHADKLERLNAAYAAITEGKRQGTDGFAVGTPFRTPGSRGDSSIDLHDVNHGESSPQLLLTLGLPSDSEDSRDEIRETVGRGTLVIRFEK